METFLREKNYKKHPRKQIRYIGENKTAIRFVDTEDREDINRMFDIASNETVQSFVDDLGMTIKDIQIWAGRHNIKKDNRDWEVLYVASGSPEYVKKEEVGEIQGFINCYTNQETRDEVKKFKTLLPDIDSNTQLVELSIAKRSQAKPGQMSSAVRQVCLELNKFKGKGDVSPEMLIFVYVKTLNNAGIEVFKRACFDNRGKINLKGEKDDYYLFTLNWDKLNSIVHSNSDKVQFTSDK